MSDRPTPEVDANLVDISGAGATVHTRYVRADLARRLERQRDELLEALKELRDWYSENTGLPAVKANAAIDAAKGGQP